MPTDDTIANAPPSDAAPSSSMYKWRSTRMTLAADHRQICNIPYHVNWRPTSVQVSATASITIEVTNAPNDVINGLVEGVNPIWTSIGTVNAINTISHPITAVRITNGSGGSLTAYVL